MAKKYKPHQVAFQNAWGEIPDGYHIHHLDNNSKNNDPNNLICVIRELHREIHEVMYDRYGVYKDFVAANRLGGCNAKWKSGADHPSYGKPSWNKGLPAPWATGKHLVGKKQSTEAIKNRMESRKGYKHSVETKNKMSSNNGSCIIIGELLFNNKSSVARAFDKSITWVTRQLKTNTLWL